MADVAIENSESTDVRFQKFATVFNQTLKQNEELRATIKTLSAELELRRSTCDFLKREILEKNAIESQTVQYARLLSKIRDLENKNTLEKEAQEKSQTIFDEEKLKLMDEIEKEKRARVEIELKLTNDLQLANNVASLQYDDLELKMQERVCSLSAQLEEANKSRNMLRSEVFSLKQRLINNNSEEKIRRLEEKLQIAEEKLRSLQEKDERLKENDGQSSKYGAVKIIDYDKERFVNPLAFKTNVSFNQCHVSEKQTKNIQRNRGKNAFPLPPLRELGQNSTKTVAKKRKLFNPDDLQYLEEEKQD